MTSSLVGSEMCIRDRLTRVGRTHEVWSGGEIEKEVLREMQMRPIIVRIHENFGHPETRDLVMALVQQKAIMPTSFAAESMRCAACSRSGYAFRS
eukprot:6213027-Prorocentrum_lima.AAC.1